MAARATLDTAEHRFTIGAGAKQTPLRPTSERRVGGQRDLFSNSWPQTSPGMTGPDLQHELTIRGQEIPIVFITAQTDETVRARSLDQGAVECLFKPFSDTALREALNAALRMS